MPVVQQERGRGSTEGWYGAARPAVSPGRQERPRSRSAGRALMPVLHCAVALAGAPRELSLYNVESDAQGTALPEVEGRL